MLKMSSSKNKGINRIELRVYSTIKKYDLIEEDDKVLVAVSGGKDSMSLLNILSKKYNVDVLFVDVGVKEFSRKSLRVIKEFCNKKGLKVRVVSFKEEVGFTIQEAFNAGFKPACRYCGVLKRYVINKAAKGYDKVATGHNLDDEVQSILMNLFKSNIMANINLGPKTGILQEKRFVQRIKPLYFIKEEEIESYAIKNKIPFVKGACPLRGETPFRYFIKKRVMELEKKIPKLKDNIIEVFLKYLKDKELINGLINEKINKKIWEGQINYCKYCGEPTRGTVCKACELRIKIKEEIRRKER